ncbi:MAG: hypothetical protein RLZZ69_231, partial [Cyanobacteriota bacterium]
MAVRDGTRGASVEQHAEERHRHVR